jgi:hypothetical protein
MRLGLVVVLEWRSYAWLKADHATLAGSLAFMRANRASLTLLKSIEHLLRLG